MGPGLIPIAYQVIAWFLSFKITSCLFRHALYADWTGYLISKIKDTSMYDFIYYYNEGLHSLSANIGKYSTLWFSIAGLLGQYCHPWLELNISPYCLPTHAIIIIIIIILIFSVISKLYSLILVFDARTISHNYENYNSILIINEHAMQLDIFRCIYYNIHYYNCID